MAAPMVLHHQYLLFCISRRTNPLCYFSRWLLFFSFVFRLVLDSYLTFSTFYVILQSLSPLNFYRLRGISVARLGDTRGTIAWARHKVLKPTQCFFVNPLIIIKRGSCVEQNTFWSKIPSGMQRPNKWNVSMPMPSLVSNHIILRMIPSKF